MKQVPSPERKFTPEELAQLYTGDCGLWQIRTLFVVALVKIPSAWQMASILFTAEEPRDFWCAPPEELAHLDLRTWKEASHPKEFDHDSGEHVWNPCYIYALNYSEMFVGDAILPILKNLPLQRCTRFEYDSVLTITTKWDLVCDRQILISVSQLFYLVGILLGAVISPMEMRRYGPRRVLICGMVFQIVFGVMAAYSPILEMKFLMRFLVACSCSNMYASSFAIATEVSHSTAKTVFACCFENFWSVGIISLAVWAYFLPNWIDLQLALSLPTFFVLMLFRLIPESPKWLLENGRYADAKLLLESAARLNRRPIPTVDIADSLDFSSRPNATWIECVKSHGFLELSLLHWCWALTFVIYYGSLVNLKSLGSDLKAITIVAGISEIVGVYFGLYLILRTRHRWFILGGVLLVVGLSTAACWFIPRHRISRVASEAAMVFLGMVPRVVIAASYTLLVATSADIFEKHHRPVAAQSCSVFAKTLLLLAPFVESTAIYGSNTSLSTYGLLLVLLAACTLVFCKQPTVRRYEAVGSPLPL